MSYSLVSRLYRLQYEKLFFMQSIKAGGGLGTRLVLDYVSEKFSIALRTEIITLKVIKL